jgi:hypothetical protein
MMHGYQCGMLWGSALAAGAQAYDLFGPGPQAEYRAVVTMQKLVESFRARTGNRIYCRDITGLDLQGKMSNVRQFTNFTIKGGAVRCLGTVVTYPPRAFQTMNRSLSEAAVCAYLTPGSCSAELGRKLGASDIHTVMAAGFAGGIGLSGGACGALGAAIWFLAMKSPQRKAKEMYANPKLVKLVNEFLRATDNKFECSEITGLVFNSISDHAEHLRSGGCSKIIETLASVTR